MQAKINTLTAEVSRLDTLIATKTKQSEYDENYWKSHYEGLEVTLNKAHDARTAMFKGKDDQYAIRDNAHKENLKDLESREQALKDGFVHLSESSNALDIIRINLEKEKSVYEEKARTIMSDLNGHINEVNAEKLKQREITINLEIQSAELEKATKEAQDIIKRINDAQMILDEANRLSSNNEKERLNLISEQEKLNELSARNRAEIQRILNDKDALDGEKRKLFQRENNIKVIEASLNKG